MYNVYIQGGGEVVPQIIANSCQKTVYTHKP